MKCPLCDSDIENRDHLFFNCHISKVFRLQVIRWWNLDDIVIDFFDDWASWFASYRLSGEAKSWLEGIFFLLWWHIWNFKSARIFAHFGPMTTILFDNFVTQTFYWCKTRAKKNIN